MLERYIFYYMIGLVGVLGIFSKILVHVTLKKLVKAASDMSKSEHLFMKLVRQKFEHACMVSDKVQNVGAFVDKYMYEYRVAKLRLHSWRQMEKTTIWLCLLAGTAGAALEFVNRGMNEMVLRYGALGAAVAIFLFLLHIAEDENYQLEATKTYMVDFLENVYARRYEKIYQSKPEPEPAEQLDEPLPVPRVIEPVREQDEALELKKIEIVPEPEVVPEPQPEEIPAEEEVGEKIPQEALIREILEEFLA